MRRVRPGPATTGSPVGRVPDPRLLRRTRTQLVLWSAGSTLVVLMALGALLYVGVARQLASDSEAQLRQRAQMMATFELASPYAAPPPSIQVPVVVGAATRGDILGGPARISFTTDGATPGILFGGTASGTIAIRDAGVGGRSDGVFDQEGYEAALTGTATMRETMLLGVPVRTWTTHASGIPSAGVIQVVADRTAELRTLQTTLVLLVTGGFVVVLVAAGFGWLYAGRALVPIRDSVRRQREFAADASHELRTPLTVIRGNVALLRAGAGGPAGEREAVEDIDVEVSRMTRLVDQLLLLARADSAAVDLDLVPCDLAQEAGDALEAFLPVAAGHAVRLELDVDTARVRGDPTRLRQLVAILVDNAVRHAPTDGHVRVRVGPAGDRARLVVEDDGPGIRPDDLPRIFDRFWRAADAPDGGSGLGLAIAAWIAHRHAGTIRAENRTTGGARFVVELPAA